MLADRLSAIQPFVVMEILERALELEREGRTIIHMEIGEPDCPTPGVITDAAMAALHAGKTKYTHSLGLQELRKAITQHYSVRYDLELDWQRVVVTMGTSPGMLAAFGSILDPGDEVILSNPGYPCYANFVKFVSGEVRYQEVAAANHFEYDAAETGKLINGSTKAIVVTSPSNPTGSLVSKATMQQVAALSSTGRLVVSDEIYHGMVYEGKEHSMLEFTDNAIVVNGFSKLYAMTGWRLGYMIVPPELVRPIQKLLQNFYISPNSFVQWAALAALEEAADDVEAMNAKYDERRRYLLPRLKELGFAVPVTPTAAFYVFADCSRFSDNSHEFALKLLEEAGVAVTPGTDFGSAGEGYVRFSYATDLENIKEGCRRLEKYLAG